MIGYAIPTTTFYAAYYGAPWPAAARCGPTVLACTNNYIYNKMQYHHLI